MAILTGTFVLSMLFYLSLTAGSGNILYWSQFEIAMGVVFSLLTAIFARALFSASGVKTGWKMLNPVRWLLFITYAIGPFLWNLTKANIDVAYRVITGRINPAIVRIDPGMKTDFGLALLANSITLTPGTLSVDADDERNLYVHCINAKKKNPKAEDVCGSFHKWAGRIAE